MKRMFRFVIVAMTMTLVGVLVPQIPHSAAQETVSQPVGMVSGAWRMMAWQVAVAPSFPEHALEARSGSNWVVLIADMTNTGLAGGFPVTDLKLGEAKVAGATTESVKVSKALGLNAIGEDGVLPVAENGISRVAIVFDYSGDPQDLTVSIGNQSVSIAPVLSDTLTVATLPPAPVGMQLEIGTIQAVPNASTLSVMIQQTGEIREISLAGIQAPPADECYGPESVQLVNDTTGGTVWIETIAGVDAPTAWYNDAANATFGLLSHTLVTNGAVDADGNGVYGNWLAPISDQMEAQKVGLWQNCKSATGEYINPPTPTPVPTPSAEEIRQAYTWVDTRELVTRPFQFEGDKIAVAGQVFNIEVDQRGTFMQIWVDTPSGREAVVVAFLGSQTPGLYQDMWVTVYGVGAGTFEGTNMVGGTISQPLLRADIVDY